MQILFIGLEINIRLDLIPNVCIIIPDLMECQDPYAIWEAAPKTAEVVGFRPP